jgi:CspA family cold shock protein
MQGTVKFYNEAKGFGFIKPSGPGEDIFDILLACWKTSA